MFPKLLTNRTKLLACAAVAAVASSPAVTSSPASADGLGIACPDQTSQPFLPWGDTANYRDVPDGGFEAAGAGWTLTGGAKVAAGNEPFFVAGQGGHALALPAGAVATTPPICVSLLSSKMRLFVRNGGAASGRLKVQAIYSGGTGWVLGTVGSTLGVSDAASLSGTARWQPSAEVPTLGGTVPLLTSSVRFRFTAAGSGWQIDDVYLDPLKHR